SMSEVIALLHASRPASDDTGPVAPPPEPRLAQAATNQGPLERGGPPRTTIDSAIFARRMLGEDMLGGQELSLRDLVMDVQSDLYGTSETGADREESTGTCEVHELSLRELAQELGEEAPRASAPRPPGTAAQPLKRTAAPQQDDTPPGAPIPCAAAQPLKPAPGPRQEATPPAAPKPSAAEAQP